MLEPRRIESNIKPVPFEYLGNNNWYYNYDIKSKVVTVPHMGEEDTEKTETWYNYILVKMVGKPDYKRCVELIIREFITLNLEFDLINSYNKATLNMLSEQEATKVSNDYLGYLAMLATIKAAIKKDFE